MAVQSQLSRSVHKIGGGFKEYAILSFYLYVCFSVILLYKTSVLRAYGISYAPYGLAAIKSLVLAKFMLVAGVLRIGERHHVPVLAYRVAYKSFSYIIFLGLLAVGEEIIAGAVHGRTTIESLSRIAGGSWLQVLATCLLFWLILIPFVALKEISGTLGKDRLHQMLFGGQSPPLHRRPR